MNDDYIVPVYVVIDDLLDAMNVQDDVRASFSSAEIVTIAIIAAKYFQNHHERALCMMYRLGYISELSVSRFNRRLHQLAYLIEQIAQVLAELLASGKIFIIDAMPVPVCKYVRASRCKKVQGELFKGYCASKKEKFFGWQLHLVCDSYGVPVFFELLPARLDELVPVQDLLAGLAEGSKVVADKGYISQLDQLLAWTHGSVYLATKFRKNMRGNSPQDAQLISDHRKMIETLNRQLEKMGLQRLHARTNQGFSVKVLASLIALTFTNFID